MTELREPILTVPETFCTVDPSMMEEVSDIIKSSVIHENHSFVWTPDNRDHYRPITLKILSALGEFADNLYTYARENTNHAFNEIIYSFDVLAVEPGKSQRGSRWHYDGDVEKTTMAVIAASALPTEFLVATNDSSDAIKEGMRYLQRFTPRSNGFENDPINRGIDEGALRLYTPDPYEAVVMTDHVHRSHQNNTMEKQARAWFRAAIR